MVSDEIKIMVENDLEKCNKIYKAIINDVDAVDIDVLEEILNWDSKYSLLISEFPKVLSLEELIKKPDIEAESIIIEYLKKTICQLDMYKKLGYPDKTLDYPDKTLDYPDKTSTIIHVENKIEISVTFEQAKQEIDRNTSLSQNEIMMLKQKIDELEQISNSKEDKNEKWNKAKEIIKWVLDKGFDIAKIIIPLAIKFE